MGGVAGVGVGVGVGGMWVLVWCGVVWWRGCGCGCGGVGGVCGCECGGVGVGGVWL